MTWEASYFGSAYLYKNYSQFLFSNFEKFFLVYYNVILCWYHTNGFLKANVYFIVKYKFSVFLSSYLFRTKKSKLRKTKNKWFLKNIILKFAVFHQTFVSQVRFPINHRFKLQPIAKNCRKNLGNFLMIWIFCAKSMMNHLL